MLDARYAAQAVVDCPLWLSATTTAASAILTYLNMCRGNVSAVSSACPCIAGVPAATSTNKANVEATSTATAAVCTATGANIETDGVGNAWTIYCSSDITMTSYASEQATYSYQDCMDVCNKEAASGCAGFTYVGDGSSTGAGPGICWLRLAGGTQIPAPTNFVLGVKGTLLPSTSSVGPAVVSTTGIADSDAASSPPLSPSTSATVVATPSPAGDGDESSSASSTADSTSSLSNSPSVLPDSSSSALSPSSQTVSTTPWSPSTQTAPSSTAGSSSATKGSFCGVKGRIKSGSESCRIADHSNRRYSTSQCLERCAATPKCRTVDNNCCLYSKSVKEAVDQHPDHVDHFWDLDCAKHHGSKRVVAEAEAVEPRKPHEHAHAHAHAHRNGRIEV
ncbi:unnamed protein product [Discula destructiva]